MARASKKARDPHPEEEVGRLGATLKAGVPPGVVLRGAERYFRDRGARLVLERAAAAGHEICKHDAKDPEFAKARLLDDLTGGALFATARCILVDNAGPLLTKGSQQFTQGIVDALLARLQSDEPGCVVLCAETLRADNAVVKAIRAREGCIIGCRKLWDTPPPWDPDPRKAELVQWLAARARGVGTQLSLEEAAYVVAATGNDLFALETQLEKLRGRGQAGVRELVGWEAGDSPFTVAEHLLLGDVPRAVAGIEALFGGGFQGRDGTRTIDVGGLSAMLVNALLSKLRETLSGARCLARGDSLETAAKSAGVQAPMARRAFEARVPRRTEGEWRRLLEDATELERRSRTGSTPDASDFAWLALHWRQRTARTARHR